MACAPTNPCLRVADVSRLAEIKLKHPRIKLLIDGTLGTPFNFRPLELGADLVTHSCSKYLAGHNDVLSGALVYAVANATAAWLHTRLSGGAS